MTTNIAAISESCGQWPLASWVDDLTLSPLQEILRKFSGQDVISFAAGLPAAEFFPAQACSLALRWVLETDRSALQYGLPSEILKEQVVTLMQRRGVSCRKENVFLTAGAQQGLSLLVRLLHDRGEAILVEEALYPGFKQIAEASSAKLVPVPSDAESGIDVDAVEHVLSRGTRPALLFVNGSAHNPLGVSMSLEKRRALANLATKYRVPVIEDDAYGFLNYDGPPAPAIRGMNEEMVCYVGSFSKILAPALRAGWIVGPQWLMPKLAMLKESSDLNICPLSHRAIARLFEIMDVPAHIEALRSEYRIRRNTMLRALDDNFANYALWHKPGGGMFIWLRLKVPVDTELLLQESVQKEKVVFLPGSAFAVAPGPSFNNCLRLNFSSVPPNRIEEGISRIGNLVKSHIATKAAAV